DGDLERVAGAVAGAVERELDLVRARVEATVAIAPAPAGAERIAGDQPGLRIEYVDPVLAPLDREVQPGGGLADVDAARFHVLVAAAELVFPAAVAVAPVVVAVLAHQGDLQALARTRPAVRAHPGELEAGIAVGIGAVAIVELRAHADQRVGRPQHPGQAAVDAAPAGFEQAGADHRRHRRGRLDLLGQGDVLP